MVVSTAFPAAAEGNLGPGPRRMIVTFDRLPVDAVERLRAAGITHAALFPAAEAAAVVGPAEGYEVIAGWEDVDEIYPERRFKTAGYEAKVQTGVSAVFEGSGKLETGYTGKGVTVAIVDSGIDTAHPDLDDRVAVNLNFEPSAVLDPITDGEYSAHHAETPIGFDDLGHGTSVAGVLAGTGEAARGSDDMRGVAPEATLINIRYGGLGTFAARDNAVEEFYETNILAAYQWLIDHKHDPRFPGGIRVASNSWGDPSAEPAPALTSILAEAVEQGIAVVFAAGNSCNLFTPCTLDEDTVWFPGNLPSLITVGMNCKPGQGQDVFLCDPNVDRSIASNSSIGPAVDVVAPGVDIWTTYTPGGLTVPGSFFFPADPEYPRAPGHGDLIDEANNRVWYWWLATGTSMSAPHVAGVVALMLESNPDLTHAEIDHILQKTATDLGPKGFDTAYGYGQVDALAAVEKAEQWRNRKFGVGLLGEEV